MDPTKEKPIASDNADQRTHRFNYGGSCVGDSMDPFFPDHLQRRDDPFRFLEPGMLEGFSFLDQSEPVKEKRVPSIIASTTKGSHPPAPSGVKTSCRLESVVKMWEKNLEKKMEKELEKIEEEQNRHSRNIGEIESYILCIMLDDHGGELSLAKLEELFGKLRERLSHECYQRLNLSENALSFALPLFTKMFQDWDPLRNPSSEHHRYLSTWKEFLQSEQLYTKLVSQVVLPNVSRVTSTWDAATDPEPMLKFLESWDNLLPSSVLATISDTVVLPKLLSAVNSWAVLSEDSNISATTNTNTVPVHVWLHPWFPFLERHSKQLECLHQMILGKLMDILNAQRPEKELAPWETAMDLASRHQLRGLINAKARVNQGKRNLGQVSNGKKVHNNSSAKEELHSWFKKLCNAELAEISKKV